MEEIVKLEQEPKEVAANNIIFIIPMGIVKGPMIDGFQHYAVLGSADNIQLGISFRCKLIYAEAIEKAFSRLQPVVMQVIPPKSQAFSSEELALKEGDKEINKTEEEASGTISKPN